MSDNASSLPAVASLPRRYAAAGAIVMAVCLIGSVRDFGAFSRAYLVAFLFWLGVTLGCLALLMVQHLTGGKWALVLRRILEAATRTLPLMAVAAIPVFLNARSLYVWARQIGRAHV